MTSLVPYFVEGGGFAGLMVLAFMTDWVYTRGYVKLLHHQLAEKDRQIETERARADIAVAAATAGRDTLIAAIRGGAYAVETVAPKSGSSAGAGPGGSGS